MRYKLIIDASEDGSLMRLPFAFGVLQRKNTRVYVLSDFPGDAHLQKVPYLVSTYLIHVQLWCLLLKMTIADFMESILVFFTVYTMTIISVCLQKYLSNQPKVSTYHTP